MFGIDSSELLIIVVVALVVIGPKDLPRVLYKIGKIVGQARGMARHFRTGFDAMIREAELEELQKQWDKENARIMAANPITDIANEMKPLADEVNGVLSVPMPQLPSLEAPAKLDGTEATSDEAVRSEAQPDDVALPAPKDGAPA